MVGVWLIWGVGKGDQIGIGANPQVRHGEAYIFLLYLIATLQRQGIHTLWLGNQCNICLILATKKEERKGVWFEKEGNTPIEGICGSTYEYSY